MAAPSFRLASILTYRESQLKEALQEMVRVEARIKSIEKALTHALRERDSTLQATVPVSGTRAADLRIATQYLFVLEQRENLLRRESQQLQTLLVRVRAAVKERHQAVDVLTRLRERQMAAARLDASRSEQRRMDEVASVQAELRRQTGEPL